jgi:signal transduction histidine kinase
VKVPEDRKDELAELATAFSKMRFEIQDRERRLARTGVKLAHSARLASIGQLGASIAHEIKNPLTIIKGHARILKDQLADNPLSESARMIWEQSDRCNHILNQMLRFSRNDNEEIKPVQMTELLQSTLLLLKAEAQKKDSKIELKILDDDLISARPQQTQQVFINLILNSIQAIPQGGKIQIQSQKNHEFMFVDVKDSGPGISFRNQSHLFQPFFTTKPKSEGTGLGLSIAQSLLEDQGGGLELIESRPGCTIFRVSLRLAEMQKLDSAMGS